MALNVPDDASRRTITTKSYTTPLDSTRASRRVAGDVLAVAGGVLLGLTAFLSYGVVLLAPIAVSVCRRRIRPLLAAGLAAGAVVLGFAALGFWWPDGPAQTRIQYARGSASTRPYLYFLFANLAALGLAVGPATVAALPHLRRSGAWLLPVAAAVGVGLADLSGLSKSAVERIWMPFTPWLLVATAALPLRRRRWWLGAQLVVGLAGRR